ncbi:uncharacterized protein si:ch211-217k17.11 [Danio rerio]|uniref:Si:ch211-217k17.11 n=1 Tax=Danio rerio TaxID=7955 RepID=H0WEZ4_DANRE|nr:uncharacterized protein si:ch211-217k17.11 [Danio rerio]|eukprot:XP_001339274.1 uncharacterized protein si:ch211-217k17.11 [Danio rerio]
MATIVGWLPTLFQAQRVGCQNQAHGLPRGDPKNTVPVPYHEPLENTSHTVLKLQEPVSPAPKVFSVFIINGSKGSRIPVTVTSTDTIEEMLQKHNLQANPNLIFNGKPVQLSQKLCDLQVKPGATFITYQKCHGG